MQKTIYSLSALPEFLEAANRRYLKFLSAIEDPRAGRNKLDKLSQPVEQEGRRYSGFNLFNELVIIRQLANGLALTFRFPAG